MEKLEKLKNLVSHSEPDISTQKLLEMGLDQLLLKKDPTLKSPHGRKSEVAATAKNFSLPTSEVKPSRYTPVQVKRAVWIQSASMCSYQSPITGRICGSKKFLEIDHKIPYSKGGLTRLENLQLLCDQHNRHKGDD